MHFGYRFPGSVYRIELLAESMAKTCHFSKKMVEKFGWSTQNFLTAGGIMLIFNSVHLWHISDIPGQFDNDPSSFASVRLEIMVKNYLFSTFLQKTHFVCGSGLVCSI